MKKIIGRSEKVILTEFSNLEITTKVDTGAFSNALHVDEVWIDRHLRFKIADREYHFENWKEVEVKNSFGQKEKRFSVLTRIKLGNKTYKTYICLTKRHLMKHPMLLGRKFLYKFGYLVDVTQKNIYAAP